MRIPCDTIARLSHLLPDPDIDRIDDALRGFRLEDGKIIVTNRRFMAIEKVDDFKGVFHIAPHQPMIEQCKVEAQFGSAIEFTVVPSLNITTAITTMGFKINENIGLFPTEPSDMDKWYDRVVKPCIEPLQESKGPMSTTTEEMLALHRAAPSGELVFANCFDPEMPTVVRDMQEDHWVGFFRPKYENGRHRKAATVPSWVL